MKLQPLHDNIIVKPDVQEDTTPSGIILREADKDRPNFGVIVAAGPGKTLANGMLQPLELRVGERVMFGPFTGRGVPFEGVVYQQMSEDDVLAVVS